MKRMKGTNNDLYVISLRLIISLMLAATLILSAGISAMACDEMSDYEMLGGYDAYEGPEAYDSYEDYLFYSSDNTQKTATAIISDEIDYSENAFLAAEGIEIIPLPAKVGATDATFKAKVINHTGSAITGTGVTLYYTYGGVVKSSIVSCNETDDEFYITMTANEHLDELLGKGLIYDYRMFVECDNQMYTHENTIRFETNSIDDKIALEVQPVAADGDGVTIDATVYNPTGATVEVIGCRLGDGTILRDEDVRSGEYTDTALSAGFRLTDADGKLKSGKKYNYEIYVICEGQEYTFGMASFTAPE